ncbi:MAG: tRNA (cytidine(34)-2'-O)-methyltransferase [Alphaproteobacteria bacterium]|nr:tRNA (cytidine(34)-2'-O)-methyltransferase [Alphaproteobacteria bacterium]
MRLALFQPDIPQNTGTLMRLCACLGVAMDIIEPCGFLLSDKNLKRAGMDYLDHLDMTRHMNWDSFKTAHAGKRIVLLTTKTDQSFIDFKFAPDDVLLAGRESAGVPDDVHNSCDARITVPMAASVRSLNVAVASAMVLSEGLRQTRLFPNCKTGKKQA